MCRLPRAHLSQNKAHGTHQSLKLLMIHLTGAMGQESQGEKQTGSLLVTTEDLGRMFTLT